LGVGQQLRAKKQNPKEPDEMRPKSLHEHRCFPSNLDKCRESSVARVCCWIWVFVALPAALSKLLTGMMPIASVVWRQRLDEVSAGSEEPQQ
jgi:hypothetical protein